MRSSLVLIFLSPLLTTAQNTQEEEELVITVGDLVQMYNEEEDGAAQVSRQTKLGKQDPVDFNSVVGIMRGGTMLPADHCNVPQTLGRRRSVLRKLCWSRRRSGARRWSVTTGL